MPWFLSRAVSAGTLYQESASVTHADVVVVGGGFAGLSAAAALAAAGADVTVLEALDGVNPTFRGELLHPRGVRALTTLGLRDAVLDAGAMPVRGFAAFASHAAGPVLLPYPRGSGLGLTLEHGVLVACLQRHLADSPRVKTIRRARVRALAMDRQRMVGVRTTDGQTHRAALIVAADGRHSHMRKLLGIPSTSTLLSYSIALPVEGGRPPRAGARARLRGGARADPRLRLRAGARSHVHRRSADRGDRQGRARRVPAGRVRAPGAGGDAPGHAGHAAGGGPWRAPPTTPSTPTPAPSRGRPSSETRAGALTRSRRPE